MEPPVTQKVSASGAGQPFGRRWAPEYQMAQFLAERGLEQEEFADNFAAWPGACQTLFELRRPELADQIWDDIWEAMPFGGNLLWVVSVKPEDTVGMIRIPENAKLTNEEGWVLSVGWGICEREPHSGRMCPFENPLDLVGHRVFWGRYTGVDLGVNAWGAPSVDATGTPIPDRNRPRIYNGRSQYSQLRIGDIYGLSFKEGGSVL